MLIVTTPSIEGQTVQKYLGLVSGEAILGANIFKDFFAGIRDIVGGRSAAYEQELRKAKQIALDDRSRKPTHGRFDPVISTRNRCHRQLLHEGSVWVGHFVHDELDPTGCTGCGKMHRNGIAHHGEVGIREGARQRPAGKLSAHGGRLLHDAHEHIAFKSGAEV